MDQVRMGIIGTGGMGIKYMKSILEGECPEVVLAAVTDSRTYHNQIEELAADKVRVFGTGSALIQSGVCDAVLISTPHYLHPALATEAFKAALHVLSEKPAGVYTKQVREMNEEADREHFGKKSVFGMMFNQRTNPLYRKIHDMVAQGGLGELKRVNWIITDWYRPDAYYNSGGWRATWAGEGGGVLINQAAHQLDLLQWICGMPRTVRAFCHEGKWHAIETEDDVTAYMEFEGGATGVFITSTGDAPGSNRLEITGTLGSLVCEHGELVLNRLGMDERDFRRTAADGFAKIPCTAETVKCEGANTQRTGVINSFAAAVLRGEPLVADGREGIKSLTISNAMYLSSWLGRPVDIPFDEDLFLNELNKKAHRAFAP